MLHLRKCFLLFLSIALVACTSMRPMELPAEAGSGPAKGAKGPLAVGDELRVTLRTDTTIDLRVTDVTPDGLAGTDRASGKPVAIAYADIKSIDRREHDPSKTTLLVIAILLGIAAVASFIADHLVVAGA